MNGRYDVFLAHNSADEPAVEALAQQLVNEGIQPWLHRWHLIPGVPWLDGIEEGLTSCTTCAVFIGPSGIGAWQHLELYAAVDRRVNASNGAFRVIPVLLPGAEHDDLG
jgi:hypothetical protein